MVQILAFHLISALNLILALHLILALNLSAVGWGEWL